MLHGPIRKQGSKEANRVQRVQYLPGTLAQHDHVQTLNESRKNVLFDHGPVGHGLFLFAAHVQRNPSTGLVQQFHSLRGIDGIGKGAQWVGGMYFDGAPDFLGVHGGGSGGSRGGGGGSRSTRLFTDAVVDDIDDFIAVAIAGTGIVTVVAAGVPVERTSHVDGLTPTVLKQLFVPRTSPHHLMATHRGSHRHNRGFTTPTLPHQQTSFRGSPQPH